jgi:hypothetical protein
LVVDWGLAKPTDRAGPGTESGERMKAREPRIIVPEQFRPREAAGRAIRLYELWNKPDQSTAWKAKVGMPDLPVDAFVGP